jgi:hypothetical protein
MQIYVNARFGIRTHDSNVRVVERNSARLRPLSSAMYLFISLPKFQFDGLNSAIIFRILTIFQSLHVL